MPQAIPWVAAYVYTAFAAVGWTGATAWAVAVATTYAAGMYALNSAIGALTPGKPKQRGGGLQLNYSGTSEPRRIIYGEVKCGGMQTIPPISTGNDGNFLHLVISVAGHECEAIGDVYFDDKTITSGTIGPITGTDDDGDVLSGYYGKHAWVRRYLGTASQAADYILTQAYASAFNSNFRGRGVAYLALRLKHGNKVFGGGVPNVTAMVKGKKCYDTRTATTAWTDNAALCVRDFLVTEVGFDSTQIDESLCNAAANICDQLVNVPDSGTEKRYTCNTVLVAAENWEDNLKQLVDAMGGRVVYRDGKWRIYAGSWEVPSITINRNDWVSPCQMQASQSREERWNAVRCWYVDRSRKYERNEAFIRTNSTYQVADNNERIYLELEIPACTSEYQAQRLSEFKLRQSRNQLKIAGRVRPEFIKLSPWDTVYVTDDDFGWSLKTFRVVSMEMTLEGNVDISLVEEGSPTWTDLDPADYNIPSDANTVDPSGAMGGAWIMDPYFKEGGAWWQVSSGGDPAVISYNPTGGLVSDGSAVLTNIGTRAFSGIQNVHSPYYQWIPGEWWRIVCRYRKVNTLAWVTTPTTIGSDGNYSANSADVLRFGVMAHRNNGLARFVIPISYTAQPKFLDYQGFETDDWQEMAANFRTPLTVDSKANWQSKYMTLDLVLGVAFADCNTTAAVEIDALDAYRINEPGAGGSGSTSFATAPDVRSGQGTGTAINPQVAAAELSRLFGMNLHAGGNATAQLDLGDVSGTICINCASSNVFRVRLVGNATLVASNPMDGQFVNVRVKQNGAGGKTLTYASYINVASGHAIAQQPDKKSHIGMFWDSVDSEFTASIGKGW